MLTEHGGNILITCQSCHRPQSGSQVAIVGRSVAAPRQLGRGRQMRTRQVETFSLRKLQQPSPGLATLLPPPTQDSGHLPRRTVHRTISRNFTVHRREIGRLVIKDHDHDQPAIVVFASVSKFHIFLYLTAYVKAPGPSPSPSIGKFRPIDSSTASPGHSRDFRVSFIDTVTTLHCCCRAGNAFIII